MNLSQQFTPLGEAGPLFKPLEVEQDQCFRCKGCGKEIEQSDGPGRPKTSWCSWECKRPAPRKDCEACGKVLVLKGERAGQRRRVRFCSTECEKDSRAALLNSACNVTCPKCGERRNKKRSESAACKKCLATERRDSGASDADIRARVGRIVTGARGRALQRGLPCDLDVGEIVRRFKAGVCEATGLSFDFRARRGRDTHASFLAPSLDRIDPRLGYVMSNVQVVCWGYNSAKGEGTHADVVALARAVVEMEDRKPGKP